MHRRRKEEKPILSSLTHSATSSRGEQSDSGASYLNFLYKSELSNNDMECFKNIELEIGRPTQKCQKERGRNQTNGELGLSVSKWKKWHSPTQQWKTHCECDIHLCRWVAGFVVYQGMHTLSLSVCMYIHSFCVCLCYKEQEYREHSLICLMINIQHKHWLNICWSIYIL